MLADIASAATDWEVGLSPANILVVDDRADGRHALRSILASESWEIVEASSGAEALKQLLRLDFAVVLLDVIMPGMDGFEVASLIRTRRRTRATPIIFLTGHAANVASIYQGYAAGAVDYLLKPLEPDVVRAKVRTFVELYRQREEIRRQATLLQEAERARLELELAHTRLAAERRYGRLAEAIPQIVWTADAEGIVDYYNRRWFEYTGLSVARGAGDWRAALHPDDAPRCLDAWHEAVRSGRAFEIEIRLKKADGTFRWHLLRARAEPCAGESRGTLWLGTFTDVDDAKRALEERTRLHREAEEAVRARDEFVSLASHEIKAPISVLLLQNQLLLRGARDESGEVPERWIAMLESSARQIDRLVRLVDEMLDVSRITAGRLHLEIEQVDLSDLVRETIARFGEALTRLSCSLRADAPVIGRWDRLRLDQITTNLLSNAIKYGGGKPIDIMVEAHGNAALLVVRDRGIGVAAEDRERIFERFERVEGTKAPGLGLGLYIVRQIVEAHGGSIVVVSETGAGSTFTVKLPLAPPRLEELEASHGA
jgi:PAS domain S-box-containing protein